ncbi:Hypothetical predicted protein, partial [Paramuricea clavata]
GPEADGGDRETAQAMLVGKKSGRVRVLLDSGSQRTFVTVKVAKALGCEVVRVENLSIGTFGQRALDSELRSVVRLICGCCKGIVEVRNPLVDFTKFWDLESIGIKDQNSDVHESVISDLKFSGTRYSVGLPWRESQDPLPTNYELSLKRMKGQIKRLNKDPVLLGDLRERWEKWLKDFSEAKWVTVERYASVSDNSLGQSSGAKYWLHGFGDASKRAYCAVIYLVTIVNDKAQVKLVASKTRVSPIKELSIPRLELMAARILAQLMDAVRQALEVEYKFEGVRYWTDSKTVLCWISNTGSWKQFVQHRVDEILRISSKRDWGHCPGIENPADLGVERGFNNRT